MVLISSANCESEWEIAIRLDTYRKFEGKWDNKGPVTINFPLIGLLLGTSSKGMGIETNHWLMADDVGIDSYVKWAWSLR